MPTWPSVGRSRSWLLVAAAGGAVASPHAPPVGTTADLAQRPCKAVEAALRAQAFSVRSMAGKHLIDALLARQHSAQEQMELSGRAYPRN